MTDSSRLLGDVSMVGTFRNRKLFVLLATAALTAILMLTLSTKPGDVTTPTFQSNVIDLQDTLPYQDLDVKTWRNLDAITFANMSMLGRILFLGEKPPKVNDTTSDGKKYQILVWKYGKTIDNRHMKMFGDKPVDPFEECSVQNCEVTYADAALKTADLVIFHLHRMKSPEDLPKVHRTGQIWAFLTDESPHHTFLNSKNNKLKDYNGVFNWSMTYRMTSDIPVPYGRTVLRKSTESKINVVKRKDVLVAILGSNCGGKNNRWQYVDELKKHIRVDVYGKCGDLQTCPGHFKSNCHDIDNYLFYLAFENSNCDEYVTEKLWWNAYEKNSIPIVMGATKSSYRSLLPPNSYLNVDDFARPQDLATYIMYLNKTGKYAGFYQWKRHFQVLNEHGYFQSRSYHYCRACEALNYNRRDTKTYSDLSQFWNSTRDCHPAWNAH